MSRIYAENGNEAICLAHYVICTVSLLCQGVGGKGGGGCNRCCGLVAALDLQRMQRSGSRFSATAICIVLGETAVTGVFLCLLLLMKTKVMELPRFFINIYEIKYRVSGT